jgi:hypothetical protein
LALRLLSLFEELHQAVDQPAAAANMLLILLSRSVIGDPHIWTHLGSVPSGAKPQAAVPTLTTSGVDLKLENLMDGIRKMNRGLSLIVGRSSLAGV